jgi:hypothetical protein
MTGNGENRLDGVFKIDASKKHWSIFPMFQHIVYFHENYGELFAQSSENTDARKLAYLQIIQFTSRTLFSIRNLVSVCFCIESLMKGQKVTRFGAIQK